MKLPKLYRKKSVVYTWFFSILSVLAVILVLNLSFNFFSLRFLKDEMLNHYESSTNLLKTTVDMRLSGVENIVNELGINSNNIILMNSSGKEGSYRKIAYNLIHELQAYKIANPLIQEVFIHYPNSGYIVSNSGFFGAHPYYYLSDFKGRISAREWDSLIAEPDSRQFKIVGNPGAGLMILKHAIPASREDMPKAIIIAVIHEAEIKEILASVKISVRPKLTLLAGNDGQVYSYYGDEQLLSRASRRIGGRTIAGNFDDFLVTKISSVFGHITYMVINKKSEILKSSDIFLNINIIGLFICLIFGGFLAYFISKKNNNSIIEAVKLISKGAKRNTDEYTYVTSYLKTVINENSEISGELEKQRLLMKRSILVKMLKGEQLDDESMKMSTALLKEEFRMPFFAVAVVNIELVDQAKEENVLWQIGDLASAVKSAISDCLKTGFDICFIHGNIILLLNLPNEKDVERVLLSEIGKVLQVIPGQFNYLSKAGIGGIYDFDRLTLSYHEAVEALEYTFENDDLQMVCYSDIEKEEVGTLRPYTSVLSKLGQLLKTKNYDDAEAVIKDIFAEYFNSSEQLENINSRKYAYIHFMVDALEELHHRSKGLPTRVWIQMLFAAKSLKALKAESINILNELKEAKKSEYKSDSKKLIDAMKRYIDENYFDPDLSLYLIAGQISMNHTQLSKLFKRHIGYGISEYINKIRIEAAKKLLSNSKITLKEIASSVGYSSDINFIRVFKKYENVTPRNYGK